MREREFFNQRLIESELEELLGDTPPSEAFAWRSPRAKALGVDAKNPPADGELIAMMLVEPYLICRPVIKIGGKATFGFDRKKIEALLAS